MKYSITHFSLGVALLATVAFVPYAVADETDDAIIRAEAEINMLSADEATRFAPADYQLAKIRLEEARKAEKEGDDTAADQRIKEARLRAEIVQAEIELGALERTRAELDTALKTLRSEINR